MQRGTTLLELMITLSILAILVAIAAPSFVNYIKDNRIQTQSNDILTAVMIARSEASKRRINVNLNATSPVTGNEFGGGWNITASGVVIRTHDDLRGNTLKALQGGASVTSLTLQPSGFLNVSGVVGTVTFTLCDTRTGAKGRTIDVIPTGRPHVSTTPATCP
jgi:type IV fimbrial biogenesis protein FimT